MRMRRCETLRAMEIPFLPEAVFLVLARGPRLTGIAKTGTKSGQTRGHRRAEVPARGRDAGSGKIQAGMGQDFRYAFRNLRRTPLFTVVALVSLALGIGANTAVFTIADQALIRKLPVRHADELVYFTDP